MCMPTASTPQHDAGDGAGAQARVIGHARLKRFAEGGGMQLLVRIYVCACVCVCIHTYIHM